MRLEVIGLYAAVILTVVVFVLAILRRYRGSIVALLLVAIAASVSIAVRWVEAGQGPFLTLYEVLISNLFSISLLGVVILAAYPGLKSGLGYASALLVCIACWLLMVDNKVVPLPPTFENNWLWVHVIAGKLFLGCLWFLSGYCLHLLMSKTADPSSRFIILRLICWALLFHGTMILAGMAWAYEAWGRYWGWDGVETWSLIICLLLVLNLHAEMVYRVPEVIRLSSVLIIFTLAFITFLGLPFFSIAPHKGIF